MTQALQIHSSQSQTTRPLVWNFSLNKQVESVALFLQHSFKTGFSSLQSLAMPLSADFWTYLEINQNG